MTKAAVTQRHRMNLSGSYHNGYSRHLQYLDHATRFFNGDPRRVRLSGERLER